MQRYVRQYNEEYLEAEDRADETFGSYVYIARLKPCKSAVWDKLMQRWVVEWQYDATEQQIKEFGLVFVRRGSLTWKS